MLCSSELDIIKIKKLIFKNIDEKINLIIRCFVYGAFFFVLVEW